MKLDPKPYERNAVHTRWLFLRGLGILCFLCFFSYLLQYEGLVGRQGLTPWVDFTRAVYPKWGWDAYLRAPSLAWLFPSDTGLFMMGCLGMGASLMLAVNLVPRFSLLVIWVLYLSLTVTGRKFMAYQWNQLLLETVFASVFLAPSTAWPSTVTLPPWCSVWYLRFVVCKLYILSGLSKWGGGGSWRDLTAMSYHYETQPLPNPISWFAYHLPDWVHHLESLGALLIEALVPLFIFTPRTVRIPVAYLMGSLQVGIMATGNYGPFNWLTLLLCVMLLDDRHLSTLAGLLPEPLRPGTVTRPIRWTWEWDLLAVVVLCVLNVVVIGSWLQLPVPGWFEATAGYAQPFRTVNPYGLFGVMTKTRPEIIIEGSRNGRVWKEYEFAYKPGDPKRAPGVAIWSLPRLDWRMWFAALKAPRRPRWIRRLFVALLRGNRAVLDHFAHNPFPGSPPRYLRAWVYRYRFSSWEEGWSTGRWWTRNNQRRYLPAVRLRAGRLVRARVP